MPAAVGKIAWLARVFGRTRQDHVEERGGGKIREKVHAGGRHSVAKTVQLRILQRRLRRVRIYVERQDVRRAGACSCKRQDAGSGADISDVLTPQVQPVDELGEIFATEKKTRMEHGRQHAQAEPCRPGGADSST